jgi:hypothetical protein
MTRRSKWTPLIVAAALSGAVWGVSAANGYALQMIWLPAVVLGLALQGVAHGGGGVPRPDPQADLARGLS